MNMFLVRRLAAMAMVPVAVMATGCAQIQLGMPAPTLNNVQKAKAVLPAPVQIGIFTAAPSLAANGGDKGINVRSNTVASPYDASFAQYLKETLAAELRAAGLVVPAADVKIEGQLTQSVLDASASGGSGTLAAVFQISRSGRKVYEKELRVSSNWDSSFVGAIAIPAAVNEYTALYPKLVAQLLDDAQFRLALKP